MNIFRKFKLRIWSRNAVSSIMQGKYQEALNWFEKIYADDPNRQGILHNLGVVHMTLGSFEEAEKFFLSDLEKYGESYQRNRILADLYYVQGRQKDALKEYEYALEERENDSDLGLLEKRIAICREEAAFTRAVEAHKEYNRGNQLFREEKKEEAYEAFKRAVELDETHYHALNNLGTMELNLHKNKEKALKWLEKANSLTEAGIVKKNLEKIKELK